MNPFDGDLTLAGQPVTVNLPAVVRAWLEAAGSSLHLLSAEVSQRGQVVATATARFIERRAIAWFGKRMP